MDPDPGPQVGVEGGHGHQLAGVALGSVVADATGGLVDLGGPPAAAIPFDAEQRLAAHEERVGSFSLGKRVRPKTVRIHERLVSAHRNKVGLDVAIEALRDCRRKKLATMEQLYSMAKARRMANVMRPYLETLG